MFVCGFVIFCFGPNLLDDVFLLDLLIFVVWVWLYLFVGFKCCLNMVDFNRFGVCLRWLLIVDVLV